jgi:hypothetical protein
MKADMEKELQKQKDIEKEIQKQRVITEGSKSKAISSRIADL